MSGSGRVDGGAAARFLKKSGLQEGVLHQVWWMWIWLCVVLDV